MYAIQRMYYKFALFIIVQAGSMRCNPASAWLPCFALEVGRWVFRRKNDNSLPLCRSGYGEVVAAGLIRVCKTAYV